MARDQHGDDINPYDLSHVAAVRKGTLYPTPPEPHSCADLVAEVERLRQRVAELEAESETWEKTSVTALVAKRWEQEARIAELEATVAELRAAWGGRGVVKR